MRDLIVAEVASVSVHGLSRTVNSKSFVARLSWSLILVCATLAFSYHLFLLTDGYRKKPINIEMKLEAVRFRFPSLYICSPFLLSYSRLISLRKEKTMQNEVYRELTQLAPQIARSRRKLTEMVYQDARLRSIPGIHSYIRSIFWSSYSSKYLNFMGVFDKYQIIIKAVADDVELNISAFEMVPSQEYYSCVFFSNASFLTSEFNTLTLYLYSDASQLNVNSLSTNLASTSYTGTYSFDRSNGLFLFFEEEGYYPGPGSMHLTASSGKHTTIFVSMTELSKMSTPADECRDKPVTVDVISHLDNSVVSYKLDRVLCESYEWALTFHRQCGCVPLHYPIPASIFSNTTRCMNVTHWSVDRVVEGLLCMKSVMQNTDVETAIQVKCAAMTACCRRTYDLRWSSAFWPTSLLIDDFIDSTIQRSYNVRTRNHHAVPAWLNVLQSNGSQRVAMFRENVAKIEIHPKKSRSMLITEKEAYPAITFFSDIGGILGLYLGMSLLSVCELLQLIAFVRLVRLRRRKERSNT